VQVMLEVGSLDRPRGLAQGEIERQVVSAARRCELRSTRSASATPISSSKLVTPSTAPAAARSSRLPGKRNRAST